MNHFDEALVRLGVMPNEVVEEITEVQALSVMLGILGSSVCQHLAELTEAIKQS